ncbi:hypothetical protein LSAT2_002090, partial [Lamellibrachia satsuma]
CSNRGGGGVGCGGGCGSGCDGGVDGHGCIMSRSNYHHQLQLRTTRKCKLSGFERHVKEEHNQWAYVFFFIHLDETRPNDYTALELYVSELLANQKYNFFPINRALGLQQEEDDNEARLQKMMSYITYLVTTYITYLVTTCITYLSFGVCLAADCLTGLVGNTLELVVLGRNGLVRTSANVYLTALAAGDSLVLMVAVYPLCAWGL